MIIIISIIFSSVISSIISTDLLFNADMVEIYSLLLFHYFSCNLICYLRLSMTN